MHCDMFSIHLLHVVVLREIFLHWALKETNYISISDDDRCDFTVIFSFLAMSNSILFSAEKS